MELYMKQVLIQLDERCARDLERVAPAKNRKRAEFVRFAIRRAIDLALDRATEQAYLKLPLAGELTPADLAGWDDHNGLARPPKKAGRRKGRTKSAV
jgi:hypothetical protein